MTRQLWYCSLSKTLRPHDSQGAVSIRKTVLLGMAIPMLKIRRPLGRLIFNMGIAIPGKTVFLIETAPRKLIATKTIFHRIGITMEIVSEMGPRPFLFSPGFGTYNSVLINFLPLSPWLGDKAYSGLILGLRPANERRCYKVTLSLSGLAQTLIGLDIMRLHGRSKWHLKPYLQTSLKRL